MIIFEGPKSNEWPEGYKRIVFDIEARTYTRRVVSKAVAPELITDTLRKIRTIGHTPVCVVGKKP